MTDKVMIDRVDVSRCEHWNICKQCQLSQLPESDYKLLCKDNPNCSFKQFARKTQKLEQREIELLNMEKARKELVNRVIMLVYECEELRVAYNEAQDILSRVNGANELKSYSLQESIKECDRYRRALEEIEKQCKCFSRSRYTQEFDREYGGELDTNILDIINKLKDDNNAR